jgi:hypothetical protein
MLPCLSRRKVELGTSVCIARVSLIKTLYFQFATLQLNYEDIYLLLLSRAHRLQCPPHTSVCSTIA